MFLAIRELELHPIDFEEVLPAGSIDLGADLRQSAVLESSGRAQLVQEHSGHRSKINDIRVGGSLDTKVEMACARCLEPVVVDVHREFDLLYRPQAADAGREELSVTAAEAEVSYYQGEGLLLEDALREQILLALPVRAICREYCKGLCPHCGKNLNLDQCSCQQPVEDPRWSALKEIRTKLED